MSWLRIMRIGLRRSIMNTSTQDLLFQQVGRLERIARKAENAGQFSAAVGAITALIIRVILCLYDFVRGNFLL